MPETYSASSAGILPARIGNIPNVAIGGVNISADNEGRYNLNALHRASGLGEEKGPAKWLRNKQAMDIVAELEAETGRICLVSIEGRNGGTFADELLAVSYAGWISPSFQLKVNRAFLDVKSGALALTPAELLLEQARMMVDVERRQAAMAAEQTEQSKRIAKTEHRLDQIETSTDHFTCIGYARWARQKSLSLEEAAKLGRKASRRCRELGVPISKIPDPRFGTVNQFPKAILDEAWKEAFGQAAYTEMRKDGTKMGVGSPEYLLLFRKLPSDRSKAYADDKVAKTKDEYSLARWQVDAHSFWRSSGDRLLTPDELAAMGPDKLAKTFTEWTLKTVYDYETHIRIGEALDARGALPSSFMSLAPGATAPWTWHDVNRMRTLNGEQSRKGLEFHICPLQFDIVDRCISRFSTKGETVFDPFGGLFTVPYRALKLGRKGRAAELNPGYFLDGIKYLEAMEREISIPSLFDAMQVDEQAAA